MTTARLIRPLGAWVVVVLTGGVLAVAVHRDEHQAGPAPASAVAVNTTTTAPPPAPPPQMPFIGREGLDRVVHAFTVDLASGHTVPSAVAPGSTRGDGPDGRRVVVDDGTTTGLPQTTCGEAGCETGSTTVRASGLSIIAADGAKTVLTSGGYDREPQWSPAGDAIAYISHRVRDGQELDVAALITPAGAARGAITPPGMADTSLTYSPDGSELAVFRRPVKQYGDGNVVIVTLRTGAERTIARGRFSELAWSPDGKAIAAIGERIQHGSGYPDGFPVARDLWLLRPDGSPALRLTDYYPAASISGSPLVSFCGSSGGYIAVADSPVWSRDGRLAFLTNHLHFNQFGRVFDVAIADLTGAENNLVIFHAPPDTCNGAAIAANDATLLFGWI